MSTLAETINLDEPQPATLWEALYREYQSRIHSYLCQRIGPDLAEDLTQDTFVRAAAALPRMSGTLQYWKVIANAITFQYCSVPPWLYRIATNLAHDALRRRQRIQWHSIDLWEEEHLIEYPATQVDDPADRVIERACLRTVLDKLPDGYREALLLSGLEGYSVQQVAQAVGIAPGGGKMYLSRARKRFRHLSTQM